MNGRIIGAAALFALSGTLVFATVASAIDDPNGIFEPDATCPAFPTTTVSGTTIPGSGSTSSPSSGTTVPGSGTTVPSGGSTTTTPGGNTSTTECTCPD